MEIVYREESYQIMGACFEVYKQLGAGFSEAVYQECLGIELESRRIPIVPRAVLNISYKGTRLRQSFEPDFMCFGKIIVELKAVAELIDVHRAQVHNYLKASGFKLGLLINFGHHPLIEYERIVR